MTVSISFSLQQPLEIILYFTLFADEETDFGVTSGFLKVTHAADSYTPAPWGPVPSSSLTALKSYPGI